MKRRAILILSRRLGFVAVLLIALSTAKAEVREFSPPPAASDAQFAYSPEQFVYSPEQEARNSWLALVLRKTGMDIWVLLMRDLLLMDDLDYPRAAALRAGLAGSTPIEAPNSSRGGCDELAPSAQANCELERDLADSGWTDPSPGSFTRLANLASDTDLRTGWGGGSFGGLTGFAFGSGSFGAAGASAGVSSEPGFDQPTGGEFFSTADLVSPFSPSAAMLPVSIPETPIPVMLLIGAGALSLAAAAKTFRGRAAAGS